MAPATQELWLCPAALLALGLLQLELVVAGISRLPRRVCLGRQLLLVVGVVGLLRLGCW